MGLRASVLITALLLIWLCSAEAAPRNHCLDCHPAHYTEQGSCRYCHRGTPQTNRKELAHGGLIKGQYAGFSNPRSAELIAGKRLAEQTACRRCHILAATGNRLASNLDNLLWTTKPELIRKALTEPALQMPDFRFKAQDLDRLVTAILSGGLQAGSISREPPQLVHFSDLQAGRQTVFSKQCGSCHKLLSKRDGGLGRGIAGPNLSGLLTRFYPPTFENGNSWNEERLKRWLKNPRDIRPQTLMRPVLLSDHEWQLLLQSLASD